MKRIPILLCLFLFAAPVRAQEKAVAPEAIEFFEKKVRPVLVEHCYSCHSAQAKRVKAGLLLDSRSGLLEGGDNGPALVPGEPDKSRLIEAVGYKSVDLKMPPKTRLPDAVIADLTAWVKMGAPWPSEKQIKKASNGDFDLQKRKKEHWAWQPIHAVDVPRVKDTAWPASDIDRFLLAKLEAKGLRPAPPADPRTLLRRLCLDIVGLPPSRIAAEEFVKAWDAPNAKRSEIIAKVVDDLLASPQFGERWARHWLDLVRYAESRGHEFDYTIPNAYQYRDYVIRALNADVPYDQFVREHIAGDLFKAPRLNPKEGFNESILGTAFWFLGEELHSPVDLRQDQADRFDNRIDVMTKTFLGLTVACARCHDHKFDAISTKDYYALFGVLESCNYRLARFDTFTNNRKIAEQLAELRRTSRSLLIPALKKALHHSPSSFKKASPQEILDAIQERTPAGLSPELAGLKNAEIVADYRRGSPKDWLTDDVTFGLGPVQRGDIVLGTSPQQPIARFASHDAAEYDRVWDGLRLGDGTQNESGALGSTVRPGRTLRTPEFTLRHGTAYALVRGSGMIYAAVSQHIMIAGPLHGRLVQRFKTGDDDFQWIPIKLAPYKGLRCHLEFTPDDGSDFAIVMVVQAAQSPGKTIPTDPHMQEANWLVQHIDQIVKPGSDEEKELGKVAAPIIEQYKKLITQIKLDSRVAPAMQEGNGIDECVFTRGNPKTLGPEVPRRFLEALAGTVTLNVKTGSGRLELARQMTDPTMTPFITRVYVNRIWHHLFGRGIVGSVDNFGVLGQAPTHPELLDYLADRFVKEGWSTKKLIRALVLTRAYQMASHPDESADQADPQNLLLHRLRMRRLEGEAIRDAILKVSGHLDTAMYGPSVPVYLTEFQQGRGRPASGPLDGDGRRSIYIAVRRNFLSPFLLAFDTPSPFSTVGRRTVSNVPAQALILMNDPFVHGQAEVWAKRVMAEKASSDERVRGMYLDAFSRPPTETELRACLAFLRDGPVDRRWADLAHVLFNTKEFYFVN